MAEAEAEDRVSPAGEAQPSRGPQGAAPGDRREADTRSLGCH
jgi:hypothetical protein